MVRLECASSARDLQDADCVRSDSRVFVLCTTNSAAIHCPASGRHGQHHDAFGDDLFRLRDFDHDCIPDSGGGRAEVRIFESTFLLFVFRRPLISAQVLGRTPLEFGVWRFIAGFAIAGLIPLVNSIISTECPPDKKGEVFGFNFLTGHAGMALGPFAAGALSGWFGYQAVIVASGLILFPLIVYLNYMRK